MVKKEDWYKNWRRDLNIVEAGVATAVVESANINSSLSGLGQPDRIKNKAAVRDHVQKWPTNTLTT